MMKCRIKADMSSSTKQMAYCFPLSCCCVFEVVYSHFHLTMIFLCRSHCSPLSYFSTTTLPSLENQSQTLSYKRNHKMTKCLLLYFLASLTLSRVMRLIIDFHNFFDKWKKKSITSSFFFVDMQKL